MRSSAKKGRKGIDISLHNRVVEICENGGTPAEAMAETGLKSTKVYEIFRYPIKKNAPSPDRLRGE